MTLQELYDSFITETKTDYDSVRAWLSDGFCKIGLGDNASCSIAHWKELTVGQAAFIFGIGLLLLLTIADKAKR